MGSDYFGPPVNRSARVMSAANGGQIVCSAATVALCRQVSFRDAGVHVLVGVGNERLFVVTGVGIGEHRGVAQHLDCGHQHRSAVVAFGGPR